VFTKVVLRFAISPHAYQTSVSVSKIGWGDQKILKVRRHGRETTFTLLFQGESDVDWEAGDHKKIGTTGLLSER